MSSPFQQAFSAKSPLHNHGDKDIAKAKKNRASANAGFMSAVGGIASSAIGAYAPGK